jgi:DeoR/GlpR family transcriptional regulator of sugar metabolism
MALFDWTSEKQANVYTAAANKKRLATEAAKLIAGGQTRNENCPTFLPHLEIA